MAFSINRRKNTKNDWRLDGVNHGVDIAYLYGRAVNTVTR